MYIVEWNDFEGNLRQICFDSMEDARFEAAYMETIYDHVEVVTV